jgi:hypothetical protein
MTPVLQLREQLFTRRVGTVPHGRQVLTQFNKRAQFVVVGEKRRQLLALRFVQTRLFLVRPLAGAAHQLVLVGGTAFFQLRQFLPIRTLERLAVTRHHFIAAWTPTDAAWVQSS